MIIQDPRSIQFGRLSQRRDLLYNSLLSRSAGFENIQGLCYEIIRIDPSVVLKEPEDVIVFCGASDVTRVNRVRSR